LNATAVLSPALGGLIIGHEVARALGGRADLAERPDKVQKLRRGFWRAAEDSGVIIEDVVTTRGATRETMVVAREAGATVVGAGAIVDRSGGAAALDVPYRSLVALALPTYDPDACPLCAEGKPITKPGSRA
jgi:orotate phosphoribosyltransferase